MADDGKVLIIDDDRAFCTLVKIALEEEGYHVYQASDGMEGLRLLAQQAPDLILLDIRMPVLDGPTFVQELRHCWDNPVPIVVVSATIKSQEQMEYLGAAGWLTKPFDLNDLMSIVDRCLGSRDRAA